MKYKKGMLVRINNTNMVFTILDGIDVGYYEVINSYSGTDYSTELYREIPFENSTTPLKTILNEIGLYEEKKRD